MDSERGDFSAAGPATVLLRHETNAVLLQYIHRLDLNLAIRTTNTFHTYYQIIFPLSTQIYDWYLL